MTLCVCVGGWGGGGDILGGSIHSPKPEEGDLTKPWSRLASIFGILNNAYCAYSV